MAVWKIKKMTKSFLKHILPIIYHALYHRFAWTYDAAAWLVSLGRWNACINHFTSYVNEGPVLELGYGPGYLQLEFTRQGFKVTGIDESSQMNRMAHTRLTKNGMESRLIKGIAQKLPYRDATFQSIVSTFPSPYIFDPQTLSEAYRALAPGGELLVLLSALFLGKGLLRRFWAWVFRGELSPNVELSQLKCRFTSQPWSVEILTPAFRDNILLIIRCRKNPELRG